MSQPNDNLPGNPAPHTPSYEEPTTPREPLPAHDDQPGPTAVSPTGARQPDGVTENRHQQGAYVTTAQGVRQSQTDHSLRAGDRGPTLLQDQHLREKLQHFDRERIPERVVHARGAGAHGVFTANGRAEGITRAAFLKKDAQTPVFVRFSTVAGFRGSIDTARDTRGFAVKFYTDEGNYDLVGNNLPVFFIQDGIKFPDVVHSVKPHMDREIPQAQSAHDSFWDFVSLHTEATFHTLFNMTDRGIPRSYRMMEGFGVHTFRLVNEAGETSLVKFHWKPRLGVHSMVWEEAVLSGGADPDLHRRDLADAIEAGAYPEWDLGVQVMPDTPDETFEGIDLLDPTKLVPEELCPVEIIGTMKLTGNPTNYFAETEQVAFAPGNLVPGIEATNDALLQARLFSYTDTHFHRLGGPNFAQLPINRPHAPVNDMQRDGFGQQALHSGTSAYHPNSVDGGCPFHADPQAAAGWLEVPKQVAGEKTRTKPASFEDHFTQPRLLWLSLTDIERQHVTDAYTFELAKCYSEVIRKRVVQEVLAHIDSQLADDVAAGLGLPKPEKVALPDPEPSAALSQIGGRFPLDGRQVAIFVDESAAEADLAAAIKTVDEAGMVPLVLAATGGSVAGATVNRALHAVRSIEFDAAIIAADSQAPEARILVDEMFRHLKAIAFVGAGAELVGRAADVSAPGVIAADSVQQAAVELADVMPGHRVWDRAR
ncbi:catalase [Corynebacterium sp. TAE3-ERU12]|uniref:catalase n=1 Tax=Corynebacterium sp. TAE3-ERU12 TaxID=2849491 RepID=UPI001C46BF02|nr:catalase [Corynebacterium sp. TAE3-ERU12]MBV7294400.1 catalase [Corynebacterium sp. TAE3-ERU12]